MRTLLIYFVKLTVTWSPIMLISQSLPSLIIGDKKGWWQITVASVITGMICSTLLLFIHEYRLRKIDSSLFNNQEQVLAISQTALFETSESKASIISTLKSHFKENFSARAENEMMIKSFSWFGFNRITLTFSKTNHMTQLRVVSRLSFPMIWVDCGERLIRIRQLEKSFGLARVS